MRRQFWTSRTFRLWFLGCLCILILPLLTSGVYYSSIQEQLEEKAYEMSQTAIEQAAAVLDENLGMLCKVGDFIDTSSEIKRIKYLSLPYSAETYWELHKRSSYLTHFSFQTDLFDSLYVYYSDMHCLMDGQRLYTELNQISTIVPRHIHMEVEELTELVSRSHFNHFHLLEDGNLLFLRTLATRGPAKRPVITLVCEVNTDILHAVLSQTAENAGGSAYLLLPSGEALGCYGQSAPRDYAAIVSAAHSVRADASGLVTVHAPSSIGEWMYVLSLPADAFLIDVVKSRNLFLAATVLSLTLGLLCCYVLTVRNYKPLHALRQRVGEGPKERDDFALIDYRLSELMAAENSMQQEIAQLDQVAAKRALHLMLTGRYGELDERQRQCLPDCGEEKHFAVAWLCRPDDQPWEMEPSSKVTTEAVLSMLLHDLCAGSCWSEVQKEKVGYAVIFCFDQDTDTVNLQMAVCSICMRLLERLTAHFGLADMRAYIGDAQTGPHNVHLSYKNALRALEYADFIPQEQQSRVLPFDPLMYSSDISFQDYDIVDAERSFVTLMLEGKYGKAEQVLHEIMTYYSGTDCMNLYVLRCRMFGVMNMMLNVLHEIEPDLTNEAFTTFSPVEALLSARSPSELEKIMFDIMGKLVGLQEGKAVDSKPRVEQIQRYIAANYFDVNLSVQMIADAYDMSLPYLSRIFKKETGSGLLDYINRYRVRKAKEFMQADRDEIIASIAARVGFNSSQTLIRAFKRCEGITPGQYKASLPFINADSSGQK